MTDPAASRPPAALAEVMPIGKHKGRAVAEVMATDPKYVEWLVLQPWFVEKYGPTYNFIVQAGPPAEMTPEHNALQAMFLDDAVCERVARAAMPAEADMKLRVTKRAMEEISDVAFEVRKNEKKTEDHRFYVEVKPVVGDDYPAVLRQMKDQQRRASRSCGFDWLRHHVLCYGAFSARGATLDQVTKIFNEAGISVVKMEDVS